MDKLNGFILQQYQSNLAHRNLMMAFVQNVLSVLLAVACSNTVYQILTVIIPDQPLLDRSIYAVLITIYSPLISWLLSKSAWAKGESFLALGLQFHGQICPVLLAWGWKDWASELDTWAGPELWDELIVALSLTCIVALMQSVPCCKRLQVAVAAGGESDTVLARFVIFPNSLFLTLGYAWNTVATYFVGKVQNLEHGYHFKFGVQAAYSLIAGAAITVIIVRLTRMTAGKEGEIACGTTNDRGIDDLHDWAGTFSLTWVKLITRSLSFVYAWAILDTMDDWAFGVMFDCSSYSKCSYQSNFYYSIVVTVFFALGVALLRRWQAFDESRVVLSKAIALQINAMMLTVGWAWMNFYSVYMTSAAKDADDEVMILLYVIVSAQICLFTSIFNYIFHRANLGDIRLYKKIVEDLQSSESPEIGRAHV